jgi:hypothetical protein
MEMITRAKQSATFTEKLILPPCDSDSESDSENDGERYGCSYSDSDND